MLLAMLTTIDNPYSPFEQWDEWFAFDTRHNYNSSALLGRVAVVSDNLSDADEAQAIEDAIDEIVKEYVTGMFRKVTKEVPSKTLGGIS